MTQEEKQLLLKDLCGGLPYGVKFTLSGGNIYTMKGIDLIVTDDGDWEYAVTAKDIEPIEIEYVKPYLRPMSSMTQEERLIYEQRLHDVGRSIDVIDADDVVSHIDWLLSRHLDFRGLIPMGLALEALPGMYETE